MLLLGFMRLTDCSISSTTSMDTLLWNLEMKTIDTANDALTSSRSPRGDGIPCLTTGSFLLHRSVPSLVAIQVWAYRASTGQHREPLGFDIQGSVRVPIMDGATLGTGPLPNIQIQIIQEIPAGMTPLGTGKEPINRHQGRPYQAALYWSCLMSSPQPTSAIAFARCDSAADF